jgi:hypothetical protein
MVKSRIILSVLAVFVGLGAFYYLYPSEEEKIKEQFSLLAKWVSMDPNENAFTVAYKMKNMGDLFTDKVNLKIPDYNLAGWFSRTDVISYAARASLPFSQFTLQFYDWQISLTDSTTANVTVTARITGKWLKEEGLEETRELAWVLRKHEKKWLFNEVEAVEVLKK